MPRRGLGAGGTVCSRQPTLELDWRQGTSAVDDVGADRAIAFPRIYLNVTRGPTESATEDGTNGRSRSVRSGR